jgi:hypothetical protein
MHVGGNFLGGIVSVALFAGAVGSAFPPAARAAEPINEQQAHAIGVEAYLYLYPLVTMDLTRRQLTNGGPSASVYQAPANAFANVPTYPPADMKAVVRPNFDTLYSSAWLDLTKEPAIVSAPDTHGHHYLLPMLDMWTDVFASPGWRTNGTAAGDFLVAPVGWTGSVPDGVTRIDAPTPYVWIIGRIKTDGPPDYDAVHTIQAGLKITPLSQWGKPPQPVEAILDPSVDMKTPPKLQVDAMPAAKYFAYAADILKLQPPHLTDEPIIARMKRIGFEPGKSFDLASADPAVRKALEIAPEDARALMGWKFKTLARVVNGWSMNTDTMGVYGNYYLKRAIVSQFRLGANVPEDAIYPANLGDAAGQPLTGMNRYSIHFEKGATPPVEAFWSITLYDQQGYQVANSLNRFAVSSWMPLKYNPDGSVDIYFQNESPGSEREANWLPAPKGPFTLTMRLYAPKSEALTGKWGPPPVTSDEGATSSVLPQ